MPFSVMIKKSYHVQEKYQDIYTNLDLMCGIQSFPKM